MTDAEWVVVRAAAAGAGSDAGPGRGFNASFRFRHGFREGDQEAVTVCGRWSESYSETVLGGTLCARMLGMTT